MYNELCYCHAADGSSPIKASCPTEGLINLIGNTGARDHRTASKKRSDEGGGGLNGTS